MFVDEWKKINMVGSNVAGLRPFVSSNMGSPANFSTFLY
jgi:hypothetical protein